MNAKLLVVVGQTTKREVTLQLPAVLGRSRKADITVAHPHVSRLHCELSEEGGVLMLRDLASLNGTMIGGRRIERAALLPDGEFTIGPLTFRVLYRYEGTLAAVPQPFYADEIPAADEAGPVVVPAPDPSVPPFVESPLPEAGSGDSIDGVIVAMPDLMALADAEVEEILPDAEIEALLPPPRFRPGHRGRRPRMPGQARAHDGRVGRAGGNRFFVAVGWASQVVTLVVRSSGPAKATGIARCLRGASAPGGAGNTASALPPSRPPKRKRGPQDQRSRRSRRKATTWIPNSAASWKGSNKIHTVLVPALRFWNKVHPRTIFKNAAFCRQYSASSLTPLEIMACLCCT